MKIQIEKEIEVSTDRNFAGLNEIIRKAKQADSVPGLIARLATCENPIDIDFFIYHGGSHIAVHEILPNGEKSERLLFIHN